MSELAPNEFRCAMCEGVFGYAWSEEEALAEAANNKVDVNHSAIICDDCYQLTPYAKTKYQ